MILVTGATGFVGGHVVRALVDAGERVRALVRDANGAGALAGVDCELARGDVTAPASLLAATEGCSAVVHLVAILTGRPEDFNRVMARGTQSLIEAARDAGVQRFVQMSALGTSEATKDTVPYYRAKWTTEEAVRASGLGYAILRPSFVFGPNGGALAQFSRIARLAPVTPVIGKGTQRLQPIWADDLARAVCLAVRRTDDVLVEIGGPDIVDWNEFWSLLKEALGTRRPTIHVPFWFMRPQAAIMERLPHPPVTRDQLQMLELGDNVVSDSGASMAAIGLDRTMPLAQQLELAVGRSQ
ncbi:NAD-dependent epimerase/dehydratase family protein [Gaiella sp.]|uniref:NAD-dependent epimerase/dehydratase family protein n=1 Tax=Gaiella sp. TaxID=2663207 RepID=UPI0032630C88